MPTLPLFQTPPSPDGWHQVRAPGGYEAWFFDLEDAGKQIRLSGLIGEGWRFSVKYYREFLRYQKRPTRNPPPLPGDYPCLEIELYQRTRLACGVFEAPAGARIRAESDRLLVTLGDNELRKEGNEIYLKLSAGMSPPMPPGKITAELTLRPKIQVTKPDQILGSTASGPYHCWRFGPFCDAEGSIVYGNQRLNIQGTASLEHRFGNSGDFQFRRGPSRILRRGRT